MLKELKEYVVLDKQIKDAESNKKNLREKVGKFLRRCRKAGVDVPGVSYSEEERYNFNEDQLFEWVKTQLDEKDLSYVTRKTIDLEKLHEVHLAGKINTEDLPEYCYTITKYFTIKVNHKKGIFNV